MIDLDHLESIRSAAIMTREALKTELSDRYVGGEGDNPEAMIIGEAPGALEDLAQRPFVGRSGNVLRQLMSFAGLNPVPQKFDESANCWITNVVKFRPLPRNRTPQPLEVKAFRTLLREEWLAIGKPKLIVPVGVIALHAVIGRQVSILRAAGKCHKYRSREGLNLAIWPMVHPSYGIRSKNEQLQEVLEADWERLGEWRR